MWRARAAEPARRTLYGPSGRQGEGHSGWLGRSKIDCLAGVLEVGNRLMLNECVDKVFSNHTGGVFSLTSPASSDIRVLSGIYSAF